MCQSAAERWTDNVWTIKSYLTRKKGMASKEVNRLVHIARARQQPHVLLSDVNPAFLGGQYTENRQFVRLSCLRSTIFSSNEESKEVIQNYCGMHTHSRPTNPLRFWWLHQLEAQTVSRIQRWGEVRPLGFPHRSVQLAPTSRWFLSQRCNGTGWSYGSSCRDEEIIDAVSTGSGEIELHGSVIGYLYMESEIHLSTA